MKKNENSVYLFNGNQNGNGKAMLNTMKIAPKKLFYWNFCNKFSK